MKYTLDRFEEGFAVFLKFPEEEEQLLIEKRDIEADLREGDIVEINKWEGKYDIKILEQETANQKKRIEELIEKLTNKNNVGED